MKNLLAVWRGSWVRLGWFGTSVFVVFLILNLRMPNAAAASPQNPAQQDESQVDQTSDDGAAALTIYNQNFFVARELVPLDLKAGDRILFGKWSGTEVKIDGEELLIMKESDVMGVVEGAPSSSKKAA